jgi:hypothetical protein
MLVVYLAHFALSMLLTAWGASLTLRALAARRAARREASSSLRSALPASVWHRYPTSPRRLAVTALLGLFTILLGAACFSVRHLLDQDQNFYLPKALSELATGLLLSGALAAALLGILADRAHGRLRCPRCWYDMQGQPTLQCPECGTTARNQRDLQRTRRSPGMFMLAAFLLLFAILPSAVVGYTVGGLRGATPTWALILFADILPTKWITPGGGHAEYGSLQDRWRYMNAINRWLLVQRMRIFIADDYSALASITPTPVTTNIDALFRSEHAIAYAAMKTDAGNDDMLVRVRAILAQPADQITNRELEELGMLASILADTRYSELRSPQTPALPTAIVERLAQAFSLRRPTLSHTASYATMLRHEDPEAAVALLFKSFEAIPPHQADSTFLVIMLQRLVQFNPEQRETLKHYLLQASPDKQAQLLSFRSMLASTGIVTKDALAALQRSSDDRVRLAATLFAAPSETTSTDTCSFIIATYNAAPGPEQYIIRELINSQCPLRDALPGLQRDLLIADADTLSELARAMNNTQFCEPQLAPIFEQLLRSGDIYAADLIYELLLQTDPDFDPAAFNSQPH